MNELAVSSLRFSDLSRVDVCGRVFFWSGRVFRAIRSESVAAVRRLLASGLIDALEREGLFPATRVTDYRVQGYELIIEHDKIAPISYPFEWSFSMLKDAARTVLRVNQIANAHGFELKDCHAYNVAFDLTQAKFLDLGSFIERPERAQGWRALEEFVQGYLYPLEIWRAGNHFIAQKILEGEHSMPHESFLLYQHPLARRFGRHLNKVAKLFYLYYKSQLISEYSPDELRERAPVQLSSLLEIALALHERGWLPFQHVDLEALRRRLERITPSAYATKWGSYHDDLVSCGTPRFERVAAVIRELGVRTVIEVAGNQGALAELLVRQSGVERVICTDSDDVAVDRMFSRLRGTAKPIVPALLDFMRPTCPATLQLPWERYRADAVVALAVTHHLLLKPPFFPMEQVLDTLARLTRRYVLVEFMPLGCHDGKAAAPLPSWYTAAWFRSELQRKFLLRREEQLEPNRILFVAELRQTVH